MRMIYRGFAAALIGVASAVAGTALSAARTTTTEAVLAYEGRWIGRAILDCAGITTPLEITVEGGEMSGKVTAKVKATRPITFPAISTARGAFLKDAWRAPSV